MDSILTDTRCTWIQRYIKMNVIVPNLEYAADVSEENAMLVNQLETVRMKGAKNVLGLSRTTVNTVLRA